MCAWTGYTLRSVPPRQLSPWEQYHLSLRATRQWRPDGEQRVEDGTKCRPKWGHQIKFFRYSWCQEPMVLLFITVCMGNTVHDHLSFSLYLNPFILHTFVTCIAHSLIHVQYKRCYLENIAKKYVNTFYSSIFGPKPLLWVMKVTVCFQFWPQLRH